MVSMARLTLRSAALSAIMLCFGCKPIGEPPPTLHFAGLPISGNLNDARRAGFNNCFNLVADRMRCRRHRVMLQNLGPYEAAVDLAGGDGSGGFDEITLWHERDNYAVFGITEQIKRIGWKYCYTGMGRWGNQAIFTRDGAPVRISMDLTYYSKRRLRIIPEWNNRERRCRPIADTSSPHGSEVLTPKEGGQQPHDSR